MKSVEANKINRNKIKQRAKRRKWRNILILNQKYIRFQKNKLDQNNNFMIYCLIKYDFDLQSINYYCFIYWIKEVSLLGLMELKKANCLTVNGVDQIDEKTVDVSRNQLKQSEQQIKKQAKVEDPNGAIDVLKQLTEKNNPLPLLAIFDKVDLLDKMTNGVSLFKLILNKSLPLEELFDHDKIKFLIDEDGKTLLHFAVEADDDQAVQWLLRKGSNNVPDKFGNTPVMDAVRLGHKRSFLLCLYYQHVHQNLAHVAAEYNRVWQLKALQALGFQIDTKNNKNKIPLEVAVQNYSYEAAEYLSMVTYNYNFAQLSYLTDSSAMIRRIRKSRMKSSFISRTLIPLISKLSIFVFLLLNVTFNQIYSDSQPRQFLFLSIYIFFFFLIFASNWVFKKKKYQYSQNAFNVTQKSNWNIDLNCVCPSCFTLYDPYNQDHCDICHCCVPKFHQHLYVCINKSNQIFWFITEFFCLYMLYSLMKNGLYYCNHKIAGQESEGFFYDIASNVYYAVYIKQRYYLGVYLIFLLILLAEQLLFCFQLFSMAAMNRTYQQVTRSQDYPHLYKKENIKRNRCAFSRDSNQWEQ